MKKTGLFSILLTLAASSAFADMSYHCTMTDAGNLSYKVLEYHVDFTHSFLSKNKVSFSVLNLAGNSATTILSGIKIVNSPTLTAGPKWSEKQNYDYSEQKFLKIQDQETNTIIGESNTVYLSEALLNGEAQAVAVYQHDVANFISYNNEFTDLACTRVK